MRFLFAALTIILLPVTVLAHALPPGTLDMRFGDHRYEAILEFSLEAVIAGLDPALEDTNEAENIEDYEALRALEPAELRAAFNDFRDQFQSQITFEVDGVVIPFEITDVIIPEVGDVELLRLSQIHLESNLPEASESLIVSSNENMSNIHLRVFTATDEIGYAKFMTPGASSDPISLTGVTDQPFWRVFTSYIFIGFEHILPLGLDHILFVVGLFLLSTQMRPLLWQVSAFTLAHTITLALGMLGIVTIPASIVEPLIAASIMYVAIENIFMSKLSPWRPAIIFVFGLLHGLGFAGVLTEFGLPKGQFVSALIGFNVGVEFGQLAVILLCFLTFGYWFGKKAWYRNVISIPMSAGIAVIAGYWVYERVFL